jgi:hypothetical protein
VDVLEHADGSVAGGFGSLSWKSTSDLCAFRAGRRRA